MNYQFKGMEKSLFDEKSVESLLKKRISIENVTEKHFGTEVVVAGFVKRIKNLGDNLKFLILSDHSGEIQLTFKSDIYKNIKAINELAPYTFIVAKGEATRGYSKKGREVVVKDFYVLGEVSAQPIPIEIEHIETSLDKRLDYRWIDLRNPKHRFPLVLLSEFTRYCREFFYKNDFVEIFSPKLIGMATESGAEVFTVPYFGKTAYLAQSPQFYKQMAICAGFEKVFEIAPVFRANPSFTTRHDTEFTSLDFEIGYVSSHYDVMSWEEKMLNYAFRRLKEKWEEKVRNNFNQEINLPKKIPKIKMEEVYEIVDKKNIKEDGDITPEGEREVSEYIKKTYGNEFAFVIDFPYKTRPFYHMKGNPMKDGTETTKSFDLLYRDIEITTGAQREHRYKVLVNQAKEKGLNIENLRYYLEFFKYGAPPMGGLGLSPTRVIMALTGAKNVREVTYLPRDPKRLFP
jgi:aspartyl-tRNA synthetase